MATAPSPLSSFLPPSSRPSGAGVARVLHDLLRLTEGWILGLGWVIALAVAVPVSIGTTPVLVGFVGLLLTFGAVRAGTALERRRAAAVLGRPVTGRSWSIGTGGLPSRAGRLLRNGDAWRDLGALAAISMIGLAAGTVALAAWTATVAMLATPVATWFAPDGSVLHDSHPLGAAGFLVAGLIATVLSGALTRALATATASATARMLEPDERAVLAARVSHLEESRAGAVESADDRLRRLERDLHDGAQHRLAYIALELARAREKLAADPDGAATLVAKAHEESRLAMGELRDLVRGIHPSVLEDRGLEAAIPGLAARNPVPVDVRVALPDRPPRAVESAAYFVVAEALTNVGRHSGATIATVRVAMEADAAVRRRAGTEAGSPADWTLRADRTPPTDRRDADLPHAPGTTGAPGRSIGDRGQWLVVEVTDDGTGGASPAPGSGLSGLAQRVDALDGRLTVTSPAGGPTVVRAELPCGS
ncbi:MAG: sensor histidine kinase [Solirubrobacteraceae bacterium]